jgi:hypothetical protein
MQVDVIVLMNYTDWERQKWRDWLLKHGEALKISRGPMETIVGLTTLILIATVSASRHSQKVPGACHGRFSSGLELLSFVHLLRKVRQSPWYRVCWTGYEVNHQVRACVRTFPGMPTPRPTDLSELACASSVAKPLPLSSTSSRN